MLNPVINQNIDEKIKHIYGFGSPASKAGLKASKGIRHPHGSVNLVNYYEIHIDTGSQ